MNKKIRNSMNKKGKRIINRETCALYAEQIYKELMNHFSPMHDVLEMVMLAYYLHQKYNTYETIEELKELALQNNVPYECVCIEHEDTGELIKLFVNKYNIEDDRFGMTYYFIQYLCIEALSILDDDDWDDDD